MSKILNELKSNYLQEELAKTYFSIPHPKENHATYSRADLKNKKGRRLLYGIFLGLSALLAITFFVFNRVEIAIKVAPAFDTGKIIYLSKGGEINTGLIKNIVFYENSSMGIDVAGYLDLSKKIFCFYSRGETGTEELRICLKDDRNNLCYSKINPLKNSWQRFIIDAKGAGDFVDVGRITHIDLEVNPRERQGQGRETAYFKDIYLAKKEDEEQ